MILQCDDRQLRAGLARRRATKVSNYPPAAARRDQATFQPFFVLHQVSVLLRGVLWPGTVAR